MSGYSRYQLGMVMTSGSQFRWDSSDLQGKGSPGMSQYLKMSLEQYCQNMATLILHKLLFFF